MPEDEKRRIKLYVHVGAVPLLIFLPVPVKCPMLMDNLCIAFVIHIHVPEKLHIALYHKPVGLHKNRIKSKNVSVENSVSSLYNVSDPILQMQSILRSLRKSQIVSFFSFFLFQLSCCSI